MASPARPHEADYPTGFLELDPPPRLCHWCGPLWPPPQPVVAVVGARSASPYGLEQAEILGFELGRRGVTVVSGLARGIDAAAHAGAIASGGAAVAVVACAPEHPPLHETAPLHRRLLESGAVCAEFDASVAARPGLFPRRNRLIAALARVVVVVEAGPGSGALITADWARRLGRVVATLPGDVTRTLAQGPLQLIQSGAAAVACADDVWRLLDARPCRPAVGSLRQPDGITTVAPQSGRRPAGRTVGEVAEDLLGSAGPLHPDALARRLDLGLPPLLALLAEWELAGRVVREGDGRYRLVRPEEAQ